ncbi:MAG: N-acetyltransferase [Bacillota bacterium]
MSEEQRDPTIDQIQCDRGIIVTEGPVKGEYLAGLEFDENLDNFRNAKKQKICLCKIADSPDGLVYIARAENTVVGYLTFHNPDPFTRWCKHPLLLELGAIEISRQWRRYKIGYHMLHKAFSNPLVKKRIVITMEYCWHWDLDGSGLNLWSYQKMLTKLFGSVGLQKVSTNDPEIMEHPANVLMARIGEDVPQEDIGRFNDLRFEKN